MTREPTVVIVGANLAGGRAAESLRAEGFEGRIVLIGDEPHRPYERPPLSKEVLRGEWSPDKPYLRGEEWYADNAVELMLGVRVTMIEPAERTVMAGGALVSYDRLLLCTGASPRVPPIPGVTLQGVHTLRTLNDATAIGEALRGGARVAIVGAGFIGCEVAASARALGCDVTIVDPAEIPMRRALGDRIGELYARLHAEHGVTLRLGVGVSSIEGGARVEKVVLSDGSAVDADLVVLGVGVAPNDELAREAGIACDNGIVVDERGETSVPGIFAAGDVARYPDPYSGEHIRVEHWQNAQNQGVAVARSILGGRAPYAEVPWFWSDQYDVNLQMVGHPLSYDRMVFRGDPAEFSFSAFYLDGERLVAAVGMNAARDVRAARALIQKGTMVDESVLSDASADLRALARA